MPEKKKARKSAAVPVQAAGPGMMFSKGSFFLPSRGPNGGKVAIPAPPPAADAFNNHRFQFVPQRRFVYDKSTGEAYAEWINDVAVCIHTGQELFRSRGFQGGDCRAPAESFDYSVPKQCHPNDFSVSTEEIVASGFLTLADFKAPDGAAIRLVDYERYKEHKKQHGVAFH
jgi:hypothetical protein